LGQLRAGMLADLALLSGDITEVPPEAIKEMQVALTLCDGRIVYEV
jgi:predicted amidohydrolase YtcJ